MDNIFNSIGARRPKSSAFNLSHSRKFSFAPGKLIPILNQEVLPSDRWSYDVNSLVRMMPMQAPVMHLVDIFSYSFFVPARLTMDRGKFEVFITGGAKGDGKDAQGNTIEIPYANFTGGAAAADRFSITADFAPGSLGDYLGIGYAYGDVDAFGPVTPISMMPFLAFWRVWCEYFRDQNLHPDYVELYPAIFSASGNITAAIKAALVDEDNPFAFWTLPYVCWEKDYFTSALPFAQRGTPVETPLTGNATVVYKEVSKVVNWQDGSDSSARTLSRGSTVGDPEAGGDLLANSDPNGTQQRLENIEEVNVDTGGFSINALRLAARLQEWLEKMARGGARYIEQIKSHFGVTSSDARLQRAEYLAGGKMPVSISEVLQTSENGETPLAEMAGHGVSAGHVTGFKKFFEEHGFIISVFFMRPRTAYQNGLPRMFSRRFDKLDWAWPSFAHLGEQEIKQSEINWQADNEPDGDDNQTFGYQQRYAEYKYIPSTVHGEFKTTLDFWAWQRDMLEEFPGGAEPSLSAAFVECHPSPRIFNVIQETDSCYAIVTNKINCVRPLPYYGEPTL